MVDTFREEKTLWARQRKILLLFIFTCACTIFKRVFNKKARTIFYYVFPGWEPLSDCVAMWLLKYTHRELCRPCSHGQKCVMNYKPQRYWERGHSSSNFHMQPCNHIECKQTIIYTCYPCETSGSTCLNLRPAGQKVSLQKRCLDGPGY